MTTTGLLLWAIMVLCSYNIVRNIILLITMQGWIVRAMQLFVSIFIILIAIYMLAGM